jgi:regulator of protease activity HflC (stomatin/prohibitin superfamily)
MATITPRPIVRHLQAGPTSYVQRLRKGAVSNEGIGLAFWFRPLVSTVSELPVDEQELPLLFRARTSDFQEVSVQATITYRIAEPARAAQRVDFSIDLVDGLWTNAPLEQLGTVLIEQAQQHAVAVLAQRTLAQVLATGIGELRAAVDRGLRADNRLDEIGIEVVGVRVIAVRPDGDIEKALQTPIREQIQQEAAKATFERRASAVEQERAIAENELANRVELARREEDLVRQEGLNEQRRTTDDVENRRIRSEASARDIEVAATAEAARIRLTGTAEAESQRAKVEAYADVRDGVLIGLALRELAGQLPDVGTLVITPDLISSLLAKAGTGGTGTGTELPAATEVTR